MPRKRPSKKDTLDISQCIPIIGDNGLVQHYDQKGKLVSEEELKSAPLEPYSDTKSHVLLTAIGNGTSLRNALEEAKISRATFLYWLSATDEFEALFNRAKEMRAESLNEAAVAEISPMMERDVNEMDHDSLALEKKKTALIEKRQAIVQAQMKIDSRRKYGDKKSFGIEAGGNISINFDVPQKLIDDMAGRFTPSINEEDNVVVVTDSES